MTGHEPDSHAAGHPSRRQLLGIGATGGALLMAGGLWPAAASATTASSKAGRRPDKWPYRPESTTLARTLLHGSPGVGGYQPLVVGPGEPHLLRADLLGPAAAHHRSGHHARRPILALGQLTDVHVMDAQSPARVEFLDRYNDPGSPLASVLPFDSSYRAHEMLSAQVADSMVRALNEVRRGPVTGLPLAFAITTGDNVDNTQYNEVRWQIDILDGGRIRPDSGDLTKYEGVPDQQDYDVHYWHPDGAPAGAAADLPHSKYGFPLVPGLLDACRKPFQAPGLRMPWLSVFGNHDGLVQGNVPSSPAIAGLATGPAKIIDLPPGTDIVQLAIGLQSGDPAALQKLFSGPVRLVTPDENRRPLSRQQTIAEHFKTTGTPHGHGFTSWNLSTGKAYYAFDHGCEQAEVRGIVLDTVNPYGGSEGSIDADQLAWLTGELTAASSRYLAADGSLVRRRTRDKLVVIYSHHTMETMTNAAGVGRVLGPAVRDLLLRFPNVVLWINGHTHRNTVTSFARPAGSTVPGGFWEINTASHIDWPQQARVVELVDNGDGTLSIFGTLIDHAAPRAAGNHPASSLALAALSRELAANDWQRPAPTATVDGRRGSALDRNVELLVPAPFALSR
ncbi:MAG: TIGR03767 family metallophosphoesterase [Actinomycetota bacterium]|nr:TIGR03767 family metallophosphoesterase [Actinomycetota bacterium]MDQ2959086.1 TIGR03767 family metallophosphoesterase [Actinomycetota bacterium]